jgi:hypothetical protein
VTHVKEITSMSQRRAEILDDLNRALAKSRDAVAA